MGNAESSAKGDRSYLDAPYASVHWNSAGRWVLVEWKEWANSPEYREVHETVLIALLENRGSKNLIDATNARVVSEDDQRWLIEDWMPRAVAGGRRWTAVVIPNRALARTISENIDKHPRPNVTKVEYFQTVEDAAAWLSTVN
jgi:hypothetical protein